MATPEERVSELGLAIPEVPAPVAAYVPAVRTGNYIYTSGQLPMQDGQLLMTGKVGGAVTAEDGTACAQRCALNAIAAGERGIGDLSRGGGGGKGGAVIAGKPGLTRPPGVAQGARRAVRKGF